MTDFDYWKHNYEDLWGATASRKERVRAILAARTRRSISMWGFGAGRHDFISGPPADWARETGDPDLAVDGTATRIEVTGSLMS